ncbi:MAG: methyl viologen-reducing hydrogenase [Deltaproteobacteria bacterium]|nr:methyl viologen-reducing hydrogenase [Deltaproteobacteria bacterium]
MAKKVTLSSEWLSGCSGCELSVVDLHEKLLTVLEEVEIVRFPILVDTKGYPEADVGLISGSLRSEHDVHCAQEMRKSCKTIIAFGTCPVYGGPQGSGYAHTNEELLHTAFVDNPTTTTSNVPTEVPALLSENRPLDTEIDVDIYLPGCPPHPAYIFEGLMALVRGRKPSIGRHNVCFNCDREMTKSDVSEIKRAFEGTPDPKTCFLSQGYLCFGSVTLDRCLAPCPKNAVPCFSCGGPSEAIITEPNKDVRSEVARRMAHLTKIPHDEIVVEVEKQAKTHYAYAMASPVFREKPTFLLRKWVEKKPVAQ